MGSTSDIGYTIVRSRRRTISIEITEDAKLLVRAPKRVPNYEIDAFVSKNRDWIDKHKDKVEKRNRLAREAVSISREELAELANRASVVIPERVRHYAALLGVTYGRITIGDQKTLWGSCSAKGNLSFNRLLMKAPERVRDYVIVHELCHRLEMNHSKAFWKHVEGVVPDHRACRRWLKEDGSLYINAVRQLYDKTDDKDGKK